MFAGRHTVHVDQLLCSATLSQHSNRTKPEPEYQQSTHVYHRHQHSISVLPIPHPSGGAVLALTAADGCMSVGDSVSRSVQQYVSAPRDCIAALQWEAGPPLHKRLPACCRRLRPATRAHLNQGCGDPFGGGPGALAIISPSSDPPVARARQSEEELQQQRSLGAAGRLGSLHPSHLSSTTTIGLQEHGAAAAAARCGCSKPFASPSGRPSGAGCAQRCARGLRCGQVTATLPYCCRGGRGGARRGVPTARALKRQHAGRRQGG